MKEKEIEQLEEVETLEEKVEDTQPEQIVIEEEHHSNRRAWRGKDLCRAAPCLGDDGGAR